MFLRSIAAFSVLSVLIIAATPVSAAPVFTGNGDPFPMGGEVLLTGSFDTPFGHVNNIVISNYNLQNIAFMGGNQTVTYTADFTNYFINGGVATPVTFTGGTFVARVMGRSSLFQTGTFNAQLLDATFSGAIMGNAVIARIDPATPTVGTVTFTGPVTQNGNLGFLVDTDFNVRGQFNVNGGPFTDAPLRGTSQPQGTGVVDVPEPGAGAVFGVFVGGLTALVGIARRRK